MHKHAQNYCAAPRVYMCTGAQTYGTAPPTAVASESIELAQTQGKVWAQLHSMRHAWEKAEDAQFPCL